MNMGGVKLLSLCYSLLLAAVQASSLVFVVEPQTTAVLLGQNLRLDCVGSRADGTTDGITLDWYFNGTRLDVGTPSTKTSRFVNNSLWVPSMTTADLGDYQCEIKKTEAGQRPGNLSRIAEVIVAYIEDKFFMSPKSVNIVESLTQITVLQCVSGFSAPPAEMWWEKDGVMFRDGVQTSGFNFGRREYGGARQKSLVIEVKSLKLYEGHYKCVARNPVSKKEVRSDPAFINVTLPQRAPTIEQEPPASAIAAENQPYLLSCFVVGHPPPVVTWIKDGRTLANDGDRYVTGNGSLQFLNVKQTDAGTYVCRGNNSIGHTDSNPSNMKVARLATVFVRQPEDTSAIAGNTATLHCTPPQSTPAPASVLWYKDNQRLNERSGTFSVQILPSGDLYFSNVQLGDAGSYFCVAENQYAIPSSRTSKAATLTVNGAPIFTVPPLPLRVIKEKMLTMTCGVAGDPIPTVRWYRTTGTRQQEITTSDPRVTFIDSNQQMTIANMNKGDEGTYKCTATNQYRTSISPQVFVFVIVPPEIIRGIGNVVGVAGNRVLLSCNVYADPTAAVTWYKENTKIEASSNIVFSTNGLEIVTVTTADQGQYKCSATNEGGQDMSSGTLAVHVTPSFIKRPADVTVNQSASLTLECKVSGIPPPVVTWTFQQQTSLPSGVSLSVGNSLLTVTSVGPEHAGIYTCQAMNSVSLITAAATVIVQVPPSITSISGNKVIGENNQLSLTCNLVGSPTPRITWLKDGSTLVADSEGRITFSQPNQLVIQFMRKSDAGQYSCSAKNAAGSSVLTVTISVKDPPLPPILKEVKPMSTSSISATWQPAQQDANNNVTGFVIEYKEVTVAAYTEFRNNIPPQTTSIEVTGLSPAKDYLVRMASKNEIGIGIFSAPWRVKTFETFPSAPRNLRSVMVTANKMELSWETPAIKNGEIRKYQLHYRRSDTGGDYTVLEITNPAIPTHTVAIENLHPNRQYEFRVRGATVEQGVTLWGNFSERVLVATKMAAPSGTPRSTQLLVKSSREIQVSWQPIVDEEQNGPLLGYKVYYRRNDSTVVMASANTSAGQFSVVIAGLLPWRVYIVEVAGYNTVGESPRSAGMTARTFAEAPSGSPENFKAVAQSSSKVLVTWEAVRAEKQNSIISGYRLEIKKSDETRRLIPVLGGSTSQQLIGGLAPHSSYTFRIQAYTEQVTPADGPFSRPVTAKTLEDRPGPVKNVVITVYQSSVQLKWSAPDDPAGVILRYHITYETVQTAPVTTSIDVSPNSTVTSDARTTRYPSRYPFINATIVTSAPELTISGLYPSSEYSFTIVAETSAGLGLQPVIINAVTLSASTNTTSDFHTVDRENATEVPVTDPLEPAPTTLPPRTSTSPAETTAPPPSALPFLLQTGNLPILISVCVVGAILLFLLIFLIVCCCCQNIRKKEQTEKAQRYFIPPSTSTRMANAGDASMTELSETERKPAVLDIVEVQSTDLDYDPNPYSLDTRNTFKIRGEAGEVTDSPQSVGSGTPNDTRETSPSNGGVNRSVSDPSYSKVKKNRGKDPIYDNAYTSMDELNLPHIPENQLKHIQHPYPSSDLGFENPNFVGENDLDKSSRSVKVTNVPETSLSTNSHELYAPVNYTKKKNRMKRTSAAAIAARKNRHIAPPHDDLDSLITNESVVVYDERTAL